MVLGVTGAAVLALALCKKCFMKVLWILYQFDVTGLAGVRHAFSRPDGRMTGSAIRNLGMGRYPANDQRLPNAGRWLRW